MNKILTILFLLIGFTSQIFAQKTVKLPSGEQIELIEKEIICYSSDHEFHGYSSAPGLKSYGAKGNSTPANFEVVYRSFPSAHQAAIDRALEILSGLINSPVTIHVNASYEDIDQPGALAGALFNTTVYDPDLNIPTFNFPNATDLNSLFPIALVEKLIGLELTDISIPDINITVNSQANWFTDFQNPGFIVPGQFDLVTIIMHEVLHGLGFAGFSGIDDMGVSSNQVGTLTSGTPVAFVFDRFVENGSGQKLGELQDGSTQLTNYLQSNDLFFNGPSMSSPARLFAPPQFNRGSSLYHLDQTTFENTDDRMMAPFYSTPDINHDPALGMEVLYDIGWDFTRVNHIPLGFLEEFNTPYTAVVSVETDSGIDTSSLELVYSQDTFKTVTTVPMNYNATAQEFEATIPAPGVATSFLYYFQLTDTRGISRSTPGGFGEQTAFLMTYGTDNTAPEIDHEPITELTTLDNSLLITSRGTDFFAGIDKMFLDATLNGTSLTSVELTETIDGFGASQFNGAVPFGRNLMATDIVTYRLRAVDKSQAANEATFPTNGSFINVPVVESRPVQTSYESSFDDNTIGDFILNGFGVELPTNFSDSCLANIMHPYPTAGAGNTLDLIAELRIPIELDADDPSIIFDEIVLVEPGEPGTTFGQTEFWDYVIVEGRKLGTEDWVAFGPGYDAQANNSWNALYNSTVTNGISTATPFPSSYQEREYDMTASTGFVAGDTIFVRFRLFSDPGAAGWGWAINNLKIQDRNSTVSVKEIDNLEYFEVYPNPTRGQGEIIIDMKFRETQSDLQFAIHDTNGRLVRNWNTSINGRESFQRINIDGIAKGVYFVSARNSKEVSVKKLLIY